MFSTKTRRGRAVRTALQGSVALMTFVTGLLIVPGFEELLNGMGVVSRVGTFGVWIGVISYVQNALEALIKYLWETRDEQSH